MNLLEFFVHNVVRCLVHEIFYNETNKVFLPCTQTFLHVIFSLSYTKIEMNTIEVKIIDINNTLTNFTNFSFSVNIIFFLFGNKVNYGKLSTKKNDINLHICFFLSFIFVLPQKLEPIVYPYKALCSLLAKYNIIKHKYLS